MIVVYKVGMGMKSDPSSWVLGETEFLVRFMGEVERARKRRGSLECLGQKKDGAK
jgi:hypothetical protein